MKRVARIYELRLRDDFNGTALSWHSSKRDANSYAASQGYPTAKREIREHEIELTRTGLLLWLSTESFAKTDNG